MMKTNGIYKTSLLAAVLLLAATSCAKKEVHSTTHPDTGKITVTADWSDRGEGVDIPSEWTVVMGDYTGTETGETHAPDYLFNPGNYTLAAYNIPENITIDGTVAKVSASSGVSTGDSGTYRNTGNSAGEYIAGNLGWFLASAQEVTVEADTDYELTATMHQIVRQLTLVIEPTGDAAGMIESIEGSLSGAAGTLDFATGTYGAASDVAMHFTRITEGDDAGKWTATVRLLGVTGEQRLTATLTYTDGSLRPTSVESNLTMALKEFNSDKTEPLTISGTAAETPTEAGMTATITDWEKIDSGEVNAGFKTF